MLQGRQSFRVTEADIFVPNVADDAQRRPVGETDSFPYVIAFDTRDPVRFPCRLDDYCNARLGVFIENLEDTFACRSPSLHQLIQLMQPADRIIKKCCEHQNRDQLAELQAAS